MENNNNSDNNNNKTQGKVIAMECGDLHCLYDVLTRYVDFLNFFIQT